MSCHDTSIVAAHSGKAFIGRDDWLFLFNDTNNVCAQLSGGKGFDQSTLTHWIEQTALRQEVCSEHGATYLLLIAPEKAVLYADKLPEVMRPIEARPVNHLLSAIVGQATVCYPVGALKSALNNKQIYNPTDTHWNDFGALVAVNAVLATIEEAPLVASHFDFFESSIVGDLGKEFQPPKTGSSLELSNICLPLWSNAIAYTGRLAHYGNGAGKGKCLVFGNSCISDAFVTYLLQSFGCVLFVFADNLDYELIAREKPRLVLHQTCERFILRTPSDRDKLSGRERGAIKHFIACINGDFDNSQLAIIASAAKQGSVDCVALYACLLKYKGHHGKAVALMNSINNPVDSNFIWSIACALSADINASLTALDRAVSCYPDRGLLRKYMGFLLTNKQYNIARSVSRELRQC